MEGEAEANLITVTTTAAKANRSLQASNIHVRIDETKELIQKLSQQKLDLTQKVNERTYERNRIGYQLEFLINCDERGMRDRIGQVRKQLDILEVRADKLQFANNAYQEKPIHASFSNQEIDNHKVNYRMIHGTDSMAKEKQLLREIKASQNAPDHDTSLSMQQLNYPTCWWHLSLRHETDPKKAKDRLREIKQHERDRDTAIANAAVKGRIWNSMGSKKDLQDQNKALRIDLDELRKMHLEIVSNITRVEKQLRAADKKLNSLKKQYEVIDAKEMKAHRRIQALLREQQSDEDAGSFLSDTN